MKVALCVALVASCAAVALAKAAGSLGENVALDDEISAVVISAPSGDDKVDDVRRARFLVQAPQSFGSHCTRSNGVKGYCNSYAHCYPYYQLSATTPAWAYGSKDSCEYSDEDGQTSYGHCCDHSLQRTTWGPLAAQHLVNQPNYWPAQQLVGAYPWAGQKSWTRWGSPALPQYPAGTVGIYPQGVYPQAVYPQGVYPQGGGYPTYPQQQPGYPFAPLHPQQQPAYPQQQRPVYPQQRPPAVAAPEPQVVVTPPTTTTTTTTTTTSRRTTTRRTTTTTTTTEDSQIGEEVDIVAAGGVGDDSQSSGSSPVQEDYSRCGVPNRPITYDQETGLDKEALERLSPELRIKGGINAQKNEWPWIAGIYKSNKQFCGGSLIDSTHILTAAHCVDHMTSSDIPDLLVKLGDHDINTSSETKTTDVKVAQIIKHKDFSQRTLHNDVAILRLSEPVEFRKNVRPVCMKSGGASVRKDTLATVVGWGLMSDVGPRPPSLQEITFKVWSNSECSNIYGSMAPGGITDHMLCAGQQGQDSCMGDSGGPMVTLSGDQYEQIGIVSWGIACGKRKFPGVYTRVGKMRGWIDRALAKY